MRVKFILCTRTNFQLFSRAAIVHPNYVAWHPHLHTTSSLVEDAALGGLLDLLGVDLEHGALVLADLLAVGLLRVDPVVAFGLAGAGQPLAVGRLGAAIVQVDLVLLGAHQGKGSRGGTAGSTRWCQGQEAIGCAGDVDVCILLVGCSVVVHCQRLVDDGDSWGRVTARGVGLDADVPVAAEGLQGLAVDSLARCGGDQVEVLLSLGEGAAGGGEGGGEHGGGLHFGCRWLKVDELVVEL